MISRNNQAADVTLQQSVLYRRQSDDESEPNGILFCCFCCRCSHHASVENSSLPPLNTSPTDNLQHDHNSDDPSTIHPTRQWTCFFHQSTGGKRKSMHDATRCEKTQKHREHQSANSLSFSQSRNIITRKCQLWPSVSRKRGFWPHILTSDPWSARWEAFRWRAAWKKLV